MHVIDCALLTQYQEHIASSVQLQVIAEVYNCMEYMHMRAMHDNAKLLISLKTLAFFFLFIFMGKKSD